MKKLFVGVLVILAAVCVFAVIQKWAGDDLDGLGGEPWILVGMEANGKRIPAEEWEGIRVQFTKGAVIWIVPTKEGLEPLDGDFRYDPKKTPKEIDLNHPFARNMSPGIYELQDGVLRVCIGARRPAEMSSKGNMVFTFKRM